MAKFINFGAVATTALIASLFSYHLGRERGFKQAADAANAVIICAIQDGKTDFCRRLLSSFDGGE